jgi:hypothetical protein
MEEFLKAVFSMRPMPRLYNEDTSSKGKTLQRALKTHTYEKASAVSFHGLFSVSFLALYYTSVE